MPSKPKKILIVEGDARLAGIYAKRFELGKWAVRTAVTDMAARKILSRSAPDAVLVDAQAVGGSAFIAELRAHPKASRAVIIALAMAGDRTAIADAYAAGADAYLLKGQFLPAEIRQKVERLLSA
jgi:DNA-binding response OmpR family regulator